MASKDPKMCKNGTAGKGKHIKWFFRLLKELGGLKVVKTEQNIMHSYNTGSSTICDAMKCKDQLLLLMASCEIVKAVFKQ
jgi:hypothetical protein